MNLKKMRNLVLSLVGALFLTVFLCGANPAKAANVTGDGHKTYFLASKTMLNKEELFGANFGAALVGQRNATGGLRLEVYYTDAEYVDLYYYIKIDGFNDEPDDIYEWVDDNTQPDFDVLPTEDGIYVNSVYCQIDDNDKVVAIYYEIGFVDGLTSGMRVFTIGGLYEDTTTLDVPAGVEQLYFTFRNENVRNDGTLIQRPDISEETTFKYFNASEQGMTDYYTDGILENLEEIKVWHDGEGRELTATVKIKYGLGTGEELYVIADSLIANFHHEMDASRISKLELVICSSSGGDLSCTWESKAIVATESRTIEGEGVHYIGYRYVSELGTSVVRLFKIELVSKPDIDVSEGLELKKSSGTKLNGSYDADGNFVYAWSNETVSLNMNATDIYQSDESAKIKQITYTYNGSTATLCKTTMGSNGCNNVHLEAKKATINFGTSDEGINTITFHMTLGDDSGTVYEVAVIVRIDLTAPVTPNIAFDNTPKEYGGKKYILSDEIVFTPVISENAAIGASLVSGLASSKMTVYKYNGSAFAAISASFNDILLESGAKINLSDYGKLETEKLYKISIVCLDKAGNTSSLDYEFYLDYGFPKFALKSSVVVDDDASTYYLDGNTNIKYYDSVIFYVNESSIKAGQSGIKSVEYCLIKLASATNVAPGVVGCEWKASTYSDSKYHGSTAGMQLSGYYRVAYRVTNNLGITNVDSNVIYNGLALAEKKYICIDNFSDEIDFTQETDEVWGNEKITLSFEVKNTFSPITTVKVEDLSDNSEITTTVLNGVYSFDILQNGNYSIKVTDIVGNESEETFEIKGIDKLDPVVSSVKYAGNYISPNTYLTEASGIVISAYDSISGIKEIVVNVYQLGTETKIFEANQSVSCSDNTCSSLTIYMSNSAISENGLYEVYVKVTDRAGNFIEFKNSSEDNYFIENDGGKVKLNGITTDVDYTGSETVEIGDNDTWEVNGIDTGIGAVYVFNYLNGSPTITVDYSLTDGGQKAAVTTRVIYGKEELYLYINLPDVTANMEIKYAICVTLSGCVDYSDVVDNKIVLNDTGLVNSGKINYVKILSAYEGATGDVSENIVSFILDNTPDNISIVADKQTTSTISKTVDINVVSDKNGGSDRNRILYFYSASQLDSIDSESYFESATAVSSTNIITATLNGYYYFFYEDKSLNQSYGYIRITVIDNVYPTVKFVDSEWKKIYQNFSTTISVVDESVSNAGSLNSQSSMVTSFAYAWTMNPEATFTAGQLTTVTTGFESVKTTTLSKTSSTYIVDGVYYLYVYVKDYVGNEYQGVNTEYYVVIDNTVPTTDNITTTIQFRSGNAWVTADSSTLWFNSSINIKIAAIEYSFGASQYVPIQSGVYGKVVYAVALSTEVDSAYTYSSHTASRFTTYVEELENGIVINNEGQYKIFIYAIDEANNVSGQVVVYINLDMTAPTLKAGYTSVLSSNFSHSVEKIENNSEGVSSFSYDSIITANDIINYTDNMDLAGVTYQFEGIFKDEDATIEYISPAAPIAYSREDKIKYTRNNFLKCAEDNQTYYIKLVLEDRAGNRYVEMIDIFIATSVPPIITLIKTTLGCDDNLATTVLCHLNVGTNQHEIKLIYGDEDINGNRYITADSRINPKEILINIGINSFTTYINAKVEDNIDRTYQITSTTYNLDLKQEGSSAYICFTATDSSGNVVGNINACNYDTDAEFREYLIEYIYQRDKANAQDGEEPPRLTSDEVANTEEYITADQNRIKLTVGYLNGPYLSFIPFDPKNTSFDSTSSDHISNYSITYLQKSIQNVTVPGYSEPGVYFADYDNVVNVYNSFSTVGDLNNKIGVEIKRYLLSNIGNERFEDTPEFILTHWSDPNYFASVDYSGGNINIETPSEDAIYVIRYVDNQHVDDSSTTRNIFRKIVYTSGVPIIDSGNYLATNVIQVEKASSDAIPIDSVVSCFVYTNMGEKDSSGCTLTWNVYDMNYKLLGSEDYSIPKNKIGAYRIIFSAIDASNTIKAPNTEIVINVVDTTAPTITFTKDSYKYMTVEYGTTFRDAYTGIIVTDDYDSGSLNYEVSGTVITTKLGCYTLLYSARDSSNNVGYNQRIVCVVDTQNPTINMKDGYVNDTTTDGNEIVNAKTYKYERSSTEAFDLRTYISSIVTSVSDNRANLTFDNIQIEELVTVNPTRCGNYVVKLSLNDLAGYTFDFGTSDVPTSIAKTTPNNIAVEYVIIQVVDTKAPEVNVTDLKTGRYISNNAIITEVNSALRVNLFDEEQYEYGDTITIKLNSNEISSVELNSSVSSNGYYHYEFIDTSGNVTTFSFVIMMASYPTIRIESQSVNFDIVNSNLTDVKNGVASVKLRKENITSGISYEAGESIVILGYSTVSSIERYDVLHTLILTESLVNLLKIDDYEFEVTGLNVDNVLITKLNVLNTKKLGIGTGNQNEQKENEDGGNNSTIGIIAIVGLVAVAGGGFILLKKKKNKN